MKPAPTKSTRGMEIISRGFGLRLVEGQWHLYMYSTTQRMWHYRMSFTPEQARDLANAAALACGPF